MPEMPDPKVLRLPSDMPLHDEEHAKALCTTLSELGCGFQMHRSGNRFQMTWDAYYAGCFKSRLL